MHSSCSSACSCSTSLQRSWVAVTTVRRVVVAEVVVEARLLERLMLDCPVVQAIGLVFVPCWPIVVNKRQNMKSAVRRVLKGTTWRRRGICVEGCQKWSWRTPNKDTLHTNAGPRSAGVAQNNVKRACTCTSGCPELRTLGSRRGVRRAQEAWAGS